MRLLRPLAASSTAFAAFAALSCSEGGDGATPTAGTPVTLVAAPTPAPTPTPTPTPLGIGIACGAAPMPECGGPEGPTGVYGCCTRESITTQGAGRWAEQINEAVDILRERRPGLFSGARVLDQDAYMKGVAEIMEEKFGVCAKQGGPRDELAVKIGNDFSEQYDILLGSLDVRRATYQVTCRPARF